MKKKLLIAIFLILAYPAYLTLRVAATFPFTPERLIVEHELQKADLIVIPSGEMERVEYAFYLAREGYADTVLYSSGYIDKYQGYYISKNMVEGIDFFVATNSISTYTDAKLTVEFLKGFEAQKIILVTSPYHSYRVYQTFTKLIPDKELISIPVKDSFFSLEEARNNKDSFSRKAFRSEQLKYLFYALRYRI
jgi:uncharacterized SAM-binding protein YcdF (DUF218 family)